MPGLGKTTTSKALCDQFHSELVGRMCRVESGDSSATPLVRQEVLKTLWGIKNDVLDSILDIDQARTLMRDCLKRDSMKRQSAVFLVIDNVTCDQHSVDEARAYLEAGFCPKSRIMVTSRGQRIVKEICGDSKFCKRVPELTEEEARASFLKIATPGRMLSILSADERLLLGLCVQQCRFTRDGTYDSGEQYHPLALRALANYCRNQHINEKSFSVWEKYLENVSRGSCPDLFDILELQFRSLNQNEQLFFMDIALHGKEWVTSGHRKAMAAHKDWILWLTGLRMDSPPAYVENILCQLERSGMIKWPGLMMHQLYIKFAVWFVTKGNSSKNEWCERESSTPPYERTRIRIVGLQGRIPRSRVQREWEFLALLQLHSCPGINLDELDRLRHLELVDLKNLETLTLSAENDSLRLVWMSGLDSLKHLPDFRSSCIFLQAIVITRCLHLTEPLKIEGCSDLRTLRTDLHLCPQLDITFTTPLRSLHRLYLSSFGGGGGGEGDVLNLGGLGLCSQLNYLTLADLPAKRVVGLAQVTSLAWLDLWGCPCLEEAPEISPVTNVCMKCVGSSKAAEIFWPKEIRGSSIEGATDIITKFKELEDEACRGGYCGAPKHSLRLKLDDSLGPSLSYDVFEYLFELYLTEEDEELERLLPGLRRSLSNGALSISKVYFDSVNAIVRRLSVGR